LEERGPAMKLKVTEQDGALTVCILGRRQEVAICEDGEGNLVFDIRERADIAGEVAVPAVVSAEEVADPPVEVAEVAEEVVDSSEEVAEEVASDPVLYGKLTALRREIATADGVPPYVVFNNKTLQLMADTLPKDMQALEGINGVGRAKSQKYGEKFLAVINGAAA